MMKVLLSLLFLFSSYQVHALDIGQVGTTVGIRRNSADADNADEDADMGLQFGLQKQYVAFEDLDFKTGIFLTQRYFEINNTDYEFLYIDVPLALKYNVNDKLSTFFGFTLGLNLSDDVEGGGDPDADLLLLQLLLGADFKITNKFHIEPFLEVGMSDAANNIDSTSAIGANLTVWFE